MDSHHHASDAHGSTAGHAAHASHPHVNYLLIFGALCICTAISVVLDVVNIKTLPNGKILLAFLVLAVATAKALFVMTYFMHLKFEGRWKFLLLSPTIVLAMGLPIALIPDVGLHYYANVAPEEDPANQPAVSPSQSVDAANSDNPRVQTIQEPVGSEGAAH